jgi:hypothetical protein
MRSPECFPSRAGNEATGCRVVSCETDTRRLIRARIVLDGFTVLQNQHDGQITSILQNHVNEIKNILLYRRPKSGA